MNYIFCPSYLSIFFALHLKNSGKEIRVITNNISIKKYCSIADIDCIYYDYISVPTTRFYKMLVLKNRIDSLIKQIGVKKEDDFYLLDNSFDTSSFYLAKEWSTKGTVYFKVIGRVFNAYKETKYLNLSFLARTGVRYLFKVLLGLDLTFLDVNGKPIWGINGKFLAKNKIKSLDLAKNLSELTLEAMRENPVKLQECDNLISTSGNLSGMVDESSLIKTCENLLNLPYRFTVKYHPRVLKTQKLARYEGLFVNCEEFPDYIPVELLLNNIRKNVISIHSALLIFASQLEHLRAISLLELVEWNNRSYKNEVKDWLMKESNNRIIFVRSFEELNKLLET